MKIIFWITLMILWGINGVCYAQNWSPFLKQAKTHYALDSSDIYSFWVEKSEVLNGDSIFVMNPVFRKGFEACGNLACGNLWMAQPPFWGDTVIQKSNGLYLFLDSTQFKIETLAGLNTTWLFDSTLNVTATITNIYATTTLTIPDSIKEISLSSGANDKILLSKQFGIIVFPDYRYHYFSPGFEIRGIQELSLGLVIPDAAMIYDFEVGDIFQYEGAINDDDFSFGYYEKSYIKEEITAKNLVANGTEYTLKRWKRRESETIDYFLGTNYYDTIYTDIPVSDTVVYYTSPLLTFVNLANLYPSSYKYYVAYPIIFRDSNDVIVKQVDEMYDEDVYFTNPDWDPYGPAVKPENEHIKHYQAYLGEIYSFDDYHDFNVPINNSYTKLVGYMKNGINMGIIYPDSFYMTPINTAAIQQVSDMYIELFPNPAKDELSVKLPNFSQELKVTIWNIEGQKLYETTLKTPQAQISIDVSTINTGLHLIILTTPQKHYQTKWIKR